MFERMPVCVVAPVGRGAKIGIPRPRRRFVTFHRSIEPRRARDGRLLSSVRRNLVAYLALFVALAGTAVAAKPLITGADIADDSLTGADVLESSLAAVPLANDTRLFGGLEPNQYVRGDGQNSVQLIGSGRLLPDESPTASRTFDTFTFTFTCAETGMTISVSHTPRSELSEKRWAYASHTDVAAGGDRSGSLQVFSTPQTLMSGTGSHYVTGFLKEAAAANPGVVFNLYMFNTPTGLPTPAGCVFGGYLVVGAIV